MHRVQCSAVRRRLALPLLLGVLCASVLLAPSAQADWVGSVGYLWNASAPFSLTVESHADASWTQRLAQGAADWSTSGVVSVHVGSSGKIALYDGFYGSGKPCAWTQFWQHGGHISHDAIYMNETCLSSWSDYWKQYAVCQELGHALGLPDHNTTPTMASCMAPGMSATTPSTEDFAELALIYGIGTTTSSNSGKAGGKGSTPLSGGTPSTTTTDTTTADTPANPGDGNGPGGNSGTGNGKGSGSKPPHP